MDWDAQRVSVAADTRLSYREGEPVAVEFDARQGFVRTCTTYQIPLPDAALFAN